MVLAADVLASRLRLRGRAECVENECSGARVGQVVSARRLAHARMVGIKSNNSDILQGWIGGTTIDDNDAFGRLILKVGLRGDTEPIHILAIPGVQLKKR
jgi:hypothetical protein